jgi:hypothetical protein
MTDSTRAAFEAWLSTVYSCGSASFERYPISVHYDSGHYRCREDQSAWEGWQAAYQAARLSALEEAARVCEAEASPRAMVKNEDGAFACACCAAAIRQLAAQADKRPAAKEE